MFAKTERVSRPQFENWFKTGKRVQDPHLTCIYTNSPTSHIAVVVSKKVAKKAHDRNQLRRRVYGVIYRELKKSGRTGVFIFLTKPSFSKITRREQLESVQKLLNRITMAQ